MSQQRRKLDTAAVDALWLSPAWHTPEGWTRFLALYDSAVGGPKLQLADVYDAAVFVSFMSWELMLRRNYNAAEEELGRLFEHPDVSDIHDDWELRCRLAFCALGSGREIEALLGFRQVLAAAPRSARQLVASFIRNHLDRGLGPEWPSKGLASAEMTRFVSELYSILKNQPTRRGRFPARTSYRKLRAYLRRTVAPPPDPDPYEDVWREVWSKVRAEGSRRGT